MRPNSQTLYIIAERVAALEDPAAVERELESLDDVDRKTVMDVVRIFFAKEYAAPCA